ncbi:hypothetical protein SAMN02745218_01147 [Desulfofundulus australicus DSM 11792]|uniref:Uncharacterized protein n=2 Tax=Desulfofundulus TaxID=2282741 RepID=A0A1M4XSI2_9FIRM|nr:hypothetical protein [Desulfofundulus australicus]AEG14490.1 hypothetical protein Desku_0891 [Desulfofundulus kuznetsovii DSM 6115]SHE96243.1 hypothetical protein SAMN02745218_01147 [Desulfofundulus australicus DSM 11792]
MFEPAYIRLAQAVVLQAIKDVIKPVRFSSNDRSARSIKADARKFIRKAVLEDGYERGIFELAGMDPRRVQAYLEERIRKKS